MTALKTGGFLTPVQAPGLRVMRIVTVMGVEEFHGNRF